VARVSHQGGTSPPRRALTRRILGEIRPFRRHLASILALDILATPILLLTPIPLKIAVDSVIGGKPLGGVAAQLVPSWISDNPNGLLIFAALLQVAIVLLSGLQEMAAYVTRTVTGERLTLRFRSRLFSHAQRLSLAFHDQRGTSDSVFRIQYDAPSIHYVTVYGFSSIFAAVISLVAMVYVIARIDLPLALVAFGVMPPLILLSRSYNRRMRPRYTEVMQLESDALQVVHEVLGAFRLVKAFGREEREGARFVSRSEQTVRERIRLAFSEGGYGLLVNLTTAIGTAAVLYIGVRNVQAHILTLGELLVIIAYLAQLYSPLKTISKEFSDLQSSLASVERSFALMDEVPDVIDRPDARPVERVRGAIEFAGVSFAYGDDPDVLHDVSFAIAAGTCLGISGRTGAGKTTLISLLARFYDAREGTIAIDGVDIRDYRLRDLRAQFSMVLQDTVLLSTTIAENIAYARPDASFDEIVAAARAAGAEEFITGLPDGYETVVGERGMRLSGGERQRISLARAFLKDAPILILDEPTSSVDITTEARIMEAMTSLMHGRTTLMIAHRLSTLEGCDARLELASGSVLQADGVVEMPDEPAPLVTPSDGFVTQSREPA
jgi:ATP-binding cassette subfamily B protein